MLTPEYLQHVAERMREKADEFEDELLFVLILALLQTKQVTAVQFYQRIMPIVEKYRVVGAQEINRALTRARNVNLQSMQALEGEPVTSPAVQVPAGAPEQAETTPETPEPTPETQVTTPKPPKWTTYEQEVARHYSETTNKEWRNITETEAYKTVQDYVSAVDKGSVRIALGEAHDKVWKDVAREFEQTGIPLQRADGKIEHASVAAERNLRTSVSRLAGDLALESAKRNGYTLVLVSAHLGARPTHETWQGKVYSLTGKTDKYDDFVTSTGYGTMLGLCGINCRHSFDPWKEGMSNPYENFDNEESRKRWNIEQEQRRLERRVRSLLRALREAEAECEARPNDPECEEHRKRAKKKWQDARKQYREFCKENDLRPLEERLKD